MVLGILPIPAPIRSVRPHGNLKFQRDSLWDVFLPAPLELPQIPAMNMLGTIAAGLLFQALIQGASFNTFTSESPKAFSIGNRDSFVAGRQGVNSLGLSIMENESAAVATYFSAWKNLIYNEKGLLEDDTRIYKKDMYIFLYDQKLKSPTNIWRLMGCFPVNVQNYQLNRENNGGPLLVNISFSVEEVKSMSDLVGGVLGSVAGSAGRIIKA